MKVVTDEFRMALNQPRQIDATITMNNGSVDVANINNITRIFNTDLFRTVMKTLVLDTNNKIELKQTVNPSFGLYVNDSFEYISLDNFKVNSSERNEDTLSYETKANDIIVESMIEYDLVVDYPINVRDYWIAIFDRLGWDISGIPETFINSTKMISQDVHSEIGYTFRDVLDELCTISCAFLVEKNGIPILVQPIETDIIIDEKYMKDTNIKIKDKVFFNSLVFSRAEETDNIFRKDEESIENNGLHELRVADNQLLSTNDRDEYIDEMWEYLKVFEYYSFDIDTRGIIFLEPVDKFTLKIGDNNYPTILLNSELLISDGVIESIYNDIPEKTVTDYKYANKTDKTMNQVYILVNKQGKQLQAVVNEQSSQATKLSLLEINNTEINEQVSNIQNVVDETTGQVVEIENTVKENITSTNAQIKVIEKQIADGVENLKNSLVTIDINGINVATNVEEFKALLNNKYVLISDSGEEIAFFGYDEILQKTIARIKELETERMTAAYHRCEPFKDDVTSEKRSGWFYIGGIS